MFTLIFLLLLGLLFLGLGWTTWKKEKIELIHSYHYKHVSEKDKAAYTKGMGISLIIIGLGMILTGVIDFTTNSNFTWLVLITFIFIGLTNIYLVQKKYNGGLF